MPLTLSLHTGHDANMTIADPKSGEVVCYVEFEKVANKRYFKFQKEARKFEAEFRLLAWPIVERYADQITRLNLCWLEPAQIEVVKARLPKAKVDVSKKHHLLHAFSVYAFTKARSGDVIVSYDGGGDMDDYFWIFGCDGQKITPMGQQIPQNLGVPYRYLGLVASEIKSDPTFKLESNQHLAGKVMGLAPRGKIRDRFLNPLRNFYRFFNQRRKAEEIEQAIVDLIAKCGLRPLSATWPKGDARRVILRRSAACDLLRSSQHVFEEEFWAHAGPSILSESCRRVLLTGGCALNVKLNSLIFERAKKDVFVLPVPGDCGISLGAAVNDTGLIKFRPFDDAFIGPRATGSILRHLRVREGKAATPEELAELLHQGKLIGTVIGQIEAGPRALGNRSLLANPCIPGMKDRLNHVKDREPFRPVAPLVTEEMQEAYFDPCPRTKYMSFSPRIKKKHAGKLKEVVHYDGTCRIQTVTRDEVFLHNLLVEVGKRTGFEVLINTSFNTKGRPIINDIDEAFVLLDTSEIDYLYVDGFLFPRRK
jgi:carbamoyltransferase